MTPAINTQSCARDTSVELTDHGEFGSGSAGDQSGQPILDLKFCSIVSHRLLSSCATVLLVFVWVLPLFTNNGTHENIKYAIAKVITIQSLGWTVMKREYDLLTHCLGINNPYERICPVIVWIMVICPFLT
ncbi:hypothetical protein AMTR_s00044p00073340 [Amborella trichopoda]|uniref:Uncharacterized protein n=1 Tax=Amborella trichopoda TaxID=13333 RepID=U5CUU8_AMBTC|nr:hypothetical protein AMTR_s00044p00073340 [Amborella trichopoda]